MLERDDPVESPAAIGDDSSEHELLALLARIEAQNPSAVAKEVDQLLGRQTVPSRVPRRTAADPDRRRPPSTAFAWYQGIVARLPAVLNSVRTVEAAEAVEAGLFAQERLDSDELIHRQLRRDLRFVARSGHDEFELLALSNLRLVFHWSKGVANSIGEDWVQDAFQAGCLGLLRGLHGWDHRRGYQLSTFVSWHIRQQIQRWRANETDLIRLPVHVWERLGSNPESLSPQVLDAAQKALSIVSLDDEKVLEELAPVAAVDGLDDLALSFERRRAVDKLLSYLDIRAARVIRLRHGLQPEADEPLTLETIGEIYGVTRERIRQIERKAMEKLAMLAAEANLDELL